MSEDNKPADVDQTVEMQLRERITVLEEWAERVAAAVRLIAGGLVVLAIATLATTLLLRKALK